jgi:PAS domain S-box-containing protein
MSDRRTSVQKLEARYKRAQEVSHVGSWEYNVSTNSFWGSDEGKRLYGLDPDVDDFSAEEVMKLVADKDREATNQAMVDLLEKNEPYDIIFDIIPKNSSKKRTIHSVAEVERDESGNPIRVNGVLQDITKRKAIEDAYKETNWRLASIMEGTHAGTWEWNVQTGEATFNSIWAEIVGYTIEEMKPVSIHTWEALAHPDDLEQSGKLLDQHFRGELPYYHYESRMKHKDGHWVWILDRGKVITWTQDGKPLMMYGTHTDITERKLAEEKIKALLAERELTLKEVHHRIKNNMSTIASLLSIQAQTLTESMAVRALEDAKSRVKSMMVLYDKLYRASGTGVISLQKYIPALLDEIIGNFANSRMVHVKTEIQDIIMDARTLQPLGIILNELVTNVMKYAFPERNDGTIQVSARYSGSAVQIIVEDDGIGIPEYIDFDKSTGFGLQLVDALVLQLKGTIHIQRNMGTKVILELEYGESALVHQVLNR